MKNSNLDHARALLDKGDFKLALMEYRSIIESEPQNAVAYQYASVALANLGDYHNALNMCAKALEFDRSLVVPHTTMAIVYDVLGERGKSRNEAKIALDKNPESPDALFCYGLLSLVDGKLDDATRFLEKAVKINPKFYLAQYNLATVYQSKKDRRKLLRQSIILFRLKPNIKSLFRMMFILSRSYKFAHFGILLIAIFLALVTGSEIVLVFSFPLMCAWVAGGVYIGFMAEKKQMDQLVIKMIVGSGIISLGLLLYLSMKHFFGI